MLLLLFLFLFFNLIDLSWFLLNRLTDLENLWSPKEKAGGGGRIN